MATSLSEPAVVEALAAQPSITRTSNGNEIPYPFPSPPDWRDHWIYFLLVDRFNNPVAPPNPDGYPCNVYQGGNFAGIKQQLQYLIDLGVGAIWISPVLINPQWFGDYWGGYGTLDFLRIEPRFCSDPVQAREDPDIADKEFRELVDEAHSLGIYVILDIVLNHVGDVFRYDGLGNEAPWKEQGNPYDISWRNGDGDAQNDWKEIENVPNVPRDGGVWPTELQRNDFFRRRGGNGNDGDFSRMKELVTEYLVPGTNLFPVRNHLIRAYQYLIAKFDLDGFRIDTLQYVESDFARVFGNAMREYALSIGKKNFFTFGEVWQDDNEAKIAEFIGRNTEKDDEFIGVDAAIDFPIRRRLVDVCKAFAPPSDLANHYDYRQGVLRKIVSSHGDAGKNYVTFLDNHDLNSRFHNKDYPAQTVIALTCLMTLQGIPCVYYGTEQGLDGNGDRREYAREALWGITEPFSTEHELYRLIKDLTLLRNMQPALRYGRQYFRPVNDTGDEHKHSAKPGGVIAFSRILNDREILIIANSHTVEQATVRVVVDKNINVEGQVWQVLFPFEQQGDHDKTCETHGVYRTIEISLGAMEVMVLKSLG